jgi:hypothetical protein
MGLFGKRIKEFNKVKDFKPQIDCIKPINWLGLKYWHLQTGGFAENGDTNCLIRTYPLFKTCDMTLDLTDNSEYKLVQIGTKLTELYKEYKTDNTIERYYVYKRLPILKLVKSDCDIFTIDSYKECKDQFGNETINKT